MSRDKVTECHERGQGDVMRERERETREGGREGEMEGRRATEREREREREKREREREREKKKKKKNKQLLSYVPLSGNRPAWGVVSRSVGQNPKRPLSKHLCSQQSN